MSLACRRLVDNFCCCSGPVISSYLFRLGRACWALLEEFKANENPKVNKNVIQCNLDSMKVLVLRI